MIDNKITIQLVFLAQADLRIKMALHLEYFLSKSNIQDIGLTCPIENIPEILQNKVILFNKQVGKVNICLNRPIDGENLKIYLVHIYFKYTI